MSGFIICTASFGAMPEIVVALRIEESMTVINLLVVFVFICQYIGNKYLPNGVGDKYTASCMVFSFL